MSEWKSANLSHILLHIDIPNQQPYHLPMLITPVHCIYLVTFDLRYQKESLSRIHSVMKDVYALPSYRSKAMGKNHLSKVLLVGMHADEIKAKERSSFAEKLNSRLEKMPYNRLVERPGGDEPFWAVDGGNLSLSGTDALSQRVKTYGCSHQVEVHQWMMYHHELLDQWKQQNDSCFCCSYRMLEGKVGNLSSDPTSLKFGECLQFLHNYGFIVYHSAKEGEDGEGSERQEIDTTVLLQPKCLCDLFARVPELSEGKDFYTINDLFARPDAYGPVGGNNKQWFRRICIDMGLVVAVKSDYVFLMALKGDPPSCPPPEEYSVPPLLMTFRDPNHLIVEPKYLLPSYVFATFATKFLRALTSQEGTLLEVQDMKQHYMQVKRGTTIIHIIEHDFCIEIGLQQQDIGILPDEKKVKKLHTTCRKVKSAVVESAESILEPSSVRYGFYHSRETDGPLDNFAAYVSGNDEEGPYLECLCCNDMPPITPLHRMWFMEDFSLEEVCMCTHACMWYTVNSHKCCSDTDMHAVTDLVYFEIASSQHLQVSVQTITVPKLSKIRKLQAVPQGEPAC